METTTTVLGRLTRFTHSALIEGCPTCSFWADNVVDIILQHKVVTVLVMFATFAKGSKVPFCDVVTQDTKYVVEGIKFVIKM